MSMVTSRTFPAFSSSHASAWSSWLPSSKVHFPPSRRVPVVSPLHPRFSTVSSGPPRPSRLAVSAGYAVSRSSAPPGWYPAASESPSAR